MKRSIAETVLGGFVLLVAGGFLTYSYKTADIGAVQGYEVTADFSSVGGLKPGDSVEISGVKVGDVKGIELLPETYLARVHIDIDSGYKLPIDTAAMISSQSLLGGLYMSLEPGAEEDTIEPGGRIQYTQAPQNLEQLLGQFIFSMQDDKDKNKDKTAEE
ncbi:MAG: outer membrane lipid asymmetry maintenance protein MlaD [Alphaproteobacteria bacterium]|nr:outer membrane lipid asymmetry maintenance protein MlaD [Alphaproteobacteria bacterium]